MAKLSQLTEITDITDSDLMMITDAETSASRRISWSNVKASINSLSGGVSSTPYKFSTATTEEPATKTLRFDSATPSSVSQVFISKTNNVSNDLSNVIPVLLAVGARIYIQVEGDSSKYLAATVTSITEVNATYTIDVTDVSAGTLPSNNSKVVLAVVGSTQADAVDGPVNFAAQADVAISRGDVVYISGASGDTPRVDLAQANSSSTMPAFGLAAEDIAQDSTGKITTLGSVEGTGAEAVDTSTLTVNQVLYVSATTAGAFTATAPSGEAKLVQNIGRVQRVAASNGVIRVGGAGRTNATPNLNDGNIFIGDGSGQASIDSLTDALSTHAGIATSLNETTFTKDVVQTPGATVTPANNGELVVEATNDTTLTFKLKGSDGVIRSGTISLS